MIGFVVKHYLTPEDPILQFDSTKASYIFLDDKDIFDGTRLTSTHASAILLEYWIYEVLITATLAGDILPEQIGCHFEIPST